MVGIYKITNPKNKVYVGQSWDISNREKYYRLSQCEKQTKLYNSIKKHGWESHKFEIVHELPPDISQEVMNIYEVFYWQQHKDCGFEMLNVRYPGSNGKLSEETILKLKKSAKGKFNGEKNGMYGKNHTNESIEKMKNTWTQEKKRLYKEMNSGNKNPMYGKENANRSEANKLQIGGNNPRARKILQYDLNGNLIQEFSCIKEAEEKTGVSKIGDKCKGYRKQTGKYIFKYKNKN
jgi:group I intron endonuclease